MKILIFLCLALILVSNVNGCSQPCDSDKNCAKKGLCCSACCGGTCHDGPNVCGPCCECRDKAGFCPSAHNCFAEPCSVTKLKCEIGEECANNYCGGCNAECVVSCAQKCKLCSTIKDKKARQKCLIEADRHCQDLGYEGCPSLSHGMNDILSIDGSEAVDSSSRLIDIEISQSVLYGGIALFMLLLIVNISCLFYVNCVKSRNGGKKIKYAKVNVIASSDDDMQNSKRVEI